jgi:Protein of unknown function (DUF3987)
VGGLVMDSKWMNPLRHQWDGDHLTVFYDEGVSFVVQAPDRRRGRLEAETTAKIGETVVNRAKIDWLDQRQRVDFHAIAAMRDGRVPWQALMVPVIGLLESPADERDADEGSPVPSAVSAGVPVERFPIQVFPQKLQRLIVEASASLPCPPDYIGAPMLPVLGTAIGTSREVEVKANWHEGARLYIGEVGHPGTKKSPAMKIAMKPLFRSQEADERSYNDEQAFYEDRLRRHEVALQVWQKEAKTQKSPPSPPTAPVAPSMRRSWTSNSTVEALAILLKENPRGVLLYQDELTAWARGMDQYRGGKGTDRQFWLSLWNGAPVAVDRKSQKGPLLLHNPCCNVIGGLPPDVLGDLSDERGRQDGFIHRVLFSYPDDVRLTWTDMAVSEAAEHGYEDVIARLRGLTPFDHDTPKRLTMTPDARRLFIEFANDLYAELADPDLPPHLRGPWLKMEGLCARLALVLQLARWAAGETERETIEPNSLIGAIALIKYFQSHARRVYASLACTPIDKKVEQAMAWIQSHGGTASVRDVIRYKVAGVKSATEAKALLRDLEDREFGKVTEEAKGRILFTLHAVCTQQ